MAMFRDRDTAAWQRGEMDDATFERRQVRWAWKVAAFNRATPAALVLFGWSMFITSIAARTPARFVRLDGLRLSVSLPAQGLLEANEGWTVLPRWDHRPGYQQLGLTERELSEDEQLTLARSGQRVLGGRLG